MTILGKVSSMFCPGLELCLSGGHIVVTKRQLHAIIIAKMGKLGPEIVSSSNF